MEFLLNYMKNDFKNISIYTTSPAELCFVFTFLRLDVSGIGMEAEVSLKHIHTRMHAYTSMYTHPRIRTQTCSLLFPL